MLTEYIKCIKNLLVKNVSVYVIFDIKSGNNVNRPVLYSDHQKPPE